MHIFHLTTRHEWDEAQAEGLYRRSTRGRSLAQVGFIHCSTREQVGPVAARVYGEVTEPLVLLAVDPDRVGVDVVYENLEGGAELFPHVYGPIPVDAVDRVEPYHHS